MRPWDEGLVASQPCGKVYSTTGEQQDPSARRAVGDLVVVRVDEHHRPAESLNLILLGR